MQQHPSRGRRRGQRQRQSCPTGSCPSNIAHWPHRLHRMPVVHMKKNPLWQHNEKPKQKSRKYKTHPKSRCARSRRVRLGQLMYVGTGDPRDLRLCADATAVAAFSVARVANVFCHALSACPRYEKAKKKTSRIPSKVQAKKTSQSMCSVKLK